MPHLKTDSIQKLLSTLNASIDHPDPKLSTNHREPTTPIKAESNASNGDIEYNQYVDTRADLASTPSVSDIAIEGGVKAWMTILGA
jgi:hypothetical protein